MGWDKVPLPKPKQERVLYGLGKQEEAVKCASIHVCMRCGGHFLLLLYYSQA